MNLGTTLAELDTALAAITGLRHIPYPDASVNAPQITLTLPDSIAFDETYRRGSDRLTLMAVLTVSMTDPRTGFASLLEYCAGSGAKSVKQAIEAGTYTQAADVRVATCDFDVYTFSGVPYYAAVFSIDIVGSGI